MESKTDHDRLTIEELFFGLAAAKDAFLIDRAARNLRPATLAFYRNELSYFLKWAPILKVRNLEDITPQILRLYFVNLGKSRTTAGSIHCAFRAIKTWLKWSWEEYQFETRCPIERVTVETPSEDPKPGIPLEDIEKLISSAADGHNANRDIALFYFLLDTGIRRQELVLLDVGDLDRDGSISIRTTKNKKARNAYLTTDTRRALADYLRERGELVKGVPLFATDEGERFSPDGLYQILRRRIKDAGISKAGLHAFRRTFALESFRAGAGEINTSKLLGHGNNHGDLNTTRRYLDLLDDDLRKAHEESSPVKKLRKRTKRK